MVLQSIKEGMSVVSYGFEAAGYNSFVPKLLKQKNIKYLNYLNINQDWFVDIYKGHDLVIEAAGNSSKKLFWQAGLVNLVLYNYTQSLSNGSLIPCLFCTSSNGMRYPVSSLELPQGSSPTAGEIRQAYELCENKALPQAVRDIAKKTFLFVHVNKSLTMDATTDLDQYFKQLPLPWENSEEYDRACGRVLPATIYDGVKSIYQNAWKTQEEFYSLFQGRFWLHAIGRFLFSVNKNEPRFEYVELEHFDELVKFYAERSHFAAAVILIDEMQNAYNKSRGYNYLVTACLKKNERSEAIHFLHQMYSYNEQNDAVKKIIAYDLKQSPQNLDAAVALVSNPRWKGIQNSQELVVEAWISSGRALEEIEKIADVMPLPRSYWLERMDRLFESVSKRAALPETPLVKTSEMGLFSSSLVKDGVTSNVTTPVREQEAVQLLSL